MTEQQTRRSHKAPFVAWILFSLCIIFLVGLAVAAYFVLKPYPTQFRADLHTASVVFSLGHWQESAGIFTSDLDRVDIEFESPCVIHSDAMASTTLDVCPPMTKVRLQSIVMPAHLQVYLDTSHDGRLRYVLQPSKSAMPELKIAVFGNSVIPEAAIARPTAKEDGLEISVLPPQNGTLEFMVRFNKPPAPEASIPITGIDFTLSEKTALAGDNNKVTIFSGSESTHVANEGLVLGGLQDTNISRLTYDAKTNLLGVIVAGQAKSIVLSNGGSQSDLVPSRLTAWSANNSAGTVVTAAGAVIAALIAILGAIKEYSVANKKHD